jgi:hypothetical protein
MPGLTVVAGPSGSSSALRSAADPCHHWAGDVSDAVPDIAGARRVDFDGRELYSEPLPLDEAGRALRFDTPLAPENSDPTQTGI